MKSFQLVCPVLLLFVFVPSLFSFSLLLKKPQFPVDEVKFAVAGKYVDRGEAYNHDCVAYIYAKHTRPADLGPGAHLRGSTETIGSIFIAAEQWFARGGRRTVNENSVHAVLYKRDIRGRLIKKYYLDIGGAPCNNRFGVHCIQYRYDRRNHCIETKCFALSGKEAANSLGIHRVSMAYRGGMLQERSFWGPTGERVEDNRGVHKEVYSSKRGLMVLYDSRGNEIKISFRKKVSDDGTYLTEKLDEKRRVVERAYWNTDDTPRCIEGGLHRKTFAFDRRGLELSHHHYGARGLPTKFHGYHCRKCIYDQTKPYMTSESYFDERMRPCVDPKKGWHRREWKYNRRGSYLSIAYFGPDGRPTPCKDGYVRVDYDKRGRPQYTKPLSKADPVKTLERHMTKPAVSKRESIVSTGKPTAAKGKRTWVDCYSYDSKKGTIVSAYFRLYQGEKKVEEFYVSHSYKTDKRTGKKIFVPLVRKIFPGAYKVEAQVYKKELRRERYFVVPKVGKGELRIDWAK